MAAKKKQKNPVSSFCSIGSGPRMPLLANWKITLQQGSRFSRLAFVHLCVLRWTFCVHFDVSPHHQPRLQNLGWKSSEALIIFPSMQHTKAKRRTPTYRLTNGRMLPTISRWEHGSEMEWVSFSLVLQLLQHGSHQTAHFKDNVLKCHLFWQAKCDPQRSNYFVSDSKAIVRPWMANFAAVKSKIPLQYVSALGRMVRTLRWMIC